MVSSDVSFVEGEEKREEAHIPPNRWNRRRISSTVVLSGTLREQKRGGRAEKERETSARDSRRLASLWRNTVESSLCSISSHLLLPTHIPPLLFTS